jgi:ATP-dependent helicase/nuclease subunit B
MPAPFPQITPQDSPIAWAIAPDASALEQLATGIWDCAMQTGQRPLVVLSTAGPLMGVRSALEKYRPPLSKLNPKNAFLPQVMSFNDWLVAAPGAWRFPKRQTDLERWLSVFAAIQKERDLRVWFKAESEAGAWGLAQAIIEACDTLSNALSPRLQKQIHALMERGSQFVIGEAWIDQVKELLESSICEVYPELSRKVVDKEAKVLLAFWRFIASASDPAFRQQFAMLAHLDAAAQAKRAGEVRPLIWVETADPTPIDQEIIGSLLQQYAQHAPVVEVKINWETVGLWAEAIGGETAAAQAITNDKKADTTRWRLISAKRFEELAWVAAKTIEQHLIADRKNIALVAQDRLVARRTRALLSRFGPALNIRDETGWKLSTTRAAAALMSWLELIQSPKDGPTAKVVLEFLQNPFLDLEGENFLNQKPGSCLGLVAELEDILIASKADSGWKTFHLAIEGVGSNALKTSSAPPNLALFQLIQFLRERHYEWLAIKGDCKKAYELLQKNLTATGMAIGLKADAAGKQLLEVLETLNLGESEYQQVPMRLSEWLSLLRTILENATYQEGGREAKASLSVLPLSSTRLRDFDAVVMVGCDEQQLPAYSEPPLFFSDALNTLLKTSTIQSQFVQQARDLSGLLASRSHVDLLWQSTSNNGEPLRPAAWIQRLQSQIQWEAMSLPLSKHEFEVKPMEMSVAYFEEDLPLPLSMSPSAYKALRDCPYRYYVRSLLGLRKTKGLDEGFDASLAGQTLHTLLQRFYQALKTQEHSMPELTTDIELRRAWMQEHLGMYSEQEFASLIEGDARVLGTLRDWQKQIPSFIDWQLQREAQGWEFLVGEVKVGFDLPFTTPDGDLKHLRIEGYADRYDVRAENKSLASVVDYKNQNFGKVKKRAEHLLDDPQLLIYARAANQRHEDHRMAGHEVVNAEWVSLKASLSKGEENAIRAQVVDGMPEQMTLFNAQITEDVEQLWAKKPMPAFAPDGVCQYCEARGVCRKGTW